MTIVRHYLSRGLFLNCVMILTVVQLLWFSHKLFFGDYDMDITEAGEINESKEFIHVAMFTPYHLTPGGGERYFLSSALVMQDLGYFVTIMIPLHSIIRTVSEVRETAEALRINLDYKRLAIELVEVRGNRHLYDASGNRIEKGIYEIFYSLGNNKLPDIFPLGEKYNMYMCQFPFNFRLPDPVLSLEIFSQYDVILLNSRYTHQWYSDSAAISYRHLMDRHMPVPSISILFPPVQPFRPPEFGSPKTQNELGNDSRALIPFHMRDSYNFTFNIVMLGRFFVGRQNKGHFAALRILQRILSSLPPSVKKMVRLVMMGNVQPEPRHRDYVSYLKGNISTLKLPVTIMNDASPEDIEQILQRSHVFWHLTGIDIVANVTMDPASMEHFGISVVEAMSAGCIPIVLGEGGTTDIVQDEVNGFWAKDERDFVSQTLKVMKMSGLLHGSNKIRYSGKLQAISDRSLQMSRRFHLDNFRHNLYQLIYQGVLSHRFREVIHQILPPQRLQVSVAKSKTNAALIVAVNVDGTFTEVVHKVMSHLPPDWGLIVVYSRYSEFFVRYALRNTKNVRFISVPEWYSITSTSDYNKLMFSSQFWRSIRAMKVLLFQPDSIILRNGIEPFMEYDYIGAPRNVVAMNQKINHTQYYQKQLVRNTGDFSLRSTVAMVRACEHLKLVSNVSTLTEPENIYFARILPSLGFKVAPIDVSYDFCVETPLPLHNHESRVQARHVPFAIHKVWFHWKPNILERWYKQLKIDAYIFSFLRVGG